jgi:aromatic ring hydroxylase
VLVPWERVFAYRDVGMVARVIRLVNRWANFSTLVRLITRMSAFIGVAELLVEWSGKARSRQSQVLMGQLISDLEVLRACVFTAQMEAVRSPGGFLAPRVTEAYRVHSIEAADRAVRVLQDLLTSSLIVTGAASDLSNAQIGAFVERYFRVRAPATRDNLRVTAVAADMVQSAFGVRNQLYERLQSGEPDDLRIRAYNRLDRSQFAERILRFVREDWDATLAPAVTDAERL